MTRTFTTISPVDGSTYAERAYATGDEIEKALSRSRQALPDWKKTSLETKAKFCRTAIKYLVERVEVLAEELTWQMGRPIAYTPFEISGGFQERAHHMIDIAAQALEDRVIPSDPGFSRYIRQEPLGTVLVLAPWNYPYLTSVNAVIPALMAGNTVILKHAQHTPLVAERYAEAFQAAGLPDGVFQYLHLDHDQVADIIGDPRTDYVCFTGSVDGGKAIQKAIGDRFVIAGLELGGKDPAYVRSDVNMEAAIAGLVDGSFFNSGQSCCGIERIYVHQSIFKDFVDGFVHLTKKYKLGNPLDKEITLGPMIRADAAAFAQRQINQAVAKGARALIDPGIFPAHQEGTPYMAPQVLVDVDHSMEVMIDETFAPVVGIMPVKDDAEAIAYMNDSHYGLTASVWTQDEAAAQRIGNQVETGTWFMNRCDYLDPALAWTGIKDSGRGCTLSALGYTALTRPKSFHLKLKT